MEQGVPCALQCLMCFEMCESVSAHKAHIEQHKKDTFYKDKFKCPEPDCPETAQQYRMLVLHFVIAHREEALRKGRTESQDTAVRRRFAVRRASTGQSRQAPDG